MVFHSNTGVCERTETNLKAKSKTLNERTNAYIQCIMSSLPLLHKLVLETS